MLAIMVDRNSWCSGGFASAPSLSIYLVPAGHEAQEMPAVFWWGNMGERDHLEDLARNGRIKLTRIFKSGEWRMVWIDLALDRQDACSCECGKEI